MRIAGTVDLHTVLGQLSEARRVFHSESDLQLALAWQVKQADPTLSVRLETRPSPGVHLDLLFDHLETRLCTAIEVKYLTRRWAGEVDGEEFDLKNHGAQDIRGYDVVKDVVRVEKLVAGAPNYNGAVVVLTNDSSYWRPPKANDTSNAVAFRLCEGSVLEGLRQWGPRTGAGTRKGREPALHLVGRYELHWRAYSCLPGGPAGELRQLVIPIANDVRGATVREGQV